MHRATLQERDKIKEDFLKIWPWYMIFVKIIPVEKLVCGNIEKKKKAVISSWGFKH